VQASGGIARRALDRLERAGCCSWRGRGTGAGRATGSGVGEGRGGYTSVEAGAARWRPGGVSGVGSGRGGWGFGARARRGAACWLWRRLVARSGSLLGLLGVAGVQGGVRVGRPAGASWRWEARERKGEEEEKVAASREEERGGCQGGLG
jgi:hypothetical protein